MHEGIPILNFLVPKEFTHENGKLTGVIFEKVKAEYDAKGRRKLVPSGEPDQHFPCDDVLVAVGQENAFPWIERDIGIEFDKWDMPKVDAVDLRLDQSEGVLRRRRRVRPEEHHLGGRARPRSRGLDRQAAQRRGHQRPAAAGGRDDQPEDGHPRMELRQRHRARQALQGAAARQGGGAEGHQGRGRARLRRRCWRFKEAARCLNCDVQTVFTGRSASSAMPASTSARWTASPSRRTARKPICARGSTRRRRTSPKISTSRTGSRPAASW